MLATSCCASSVLKVAKCLANWIPNHHDEVACFEKKLIASLSGCMQGTLSAKKERERMWSYHLLHTSDDYIGKWCTVLQRRVFLRCLRSSTSMLWITCSNS